MSQNRASRRAFPVLIVLAALLLASLPAQAKPAAGSLKPIAFAENSLARLWSFVAQLWQPGSMTKEGTSIDPDGRNGSGATLPVGGGDDEGMSIDPDGKG